MHGAGQRVNRGTGAGQLAFKFLALQFGLPHDHGLTRLDLLGVGLRHVHKQTQRVGLRDHKESSGQATDCTGIDQIAGVYVAASDHAIGR